MQSILTSISEKYQFRTNQIKQLLDYYYYFNEDDDDIVDNVFIYGPKNTGKTSIVNEVLKSLDKIRFSIVNLSICYTNRQLFQKILKNFQEPQNNNLTNSEIWNTDNGEFNYSNLEDFLNELGRIINEKLYNQMIVLVFDNAEFLRNDDFVFNVFLRIKEFINYSRISTIWISNLVPEQFYSMSGNGSLINTSKIFFNSYSKNELLKLLVASCPAVGKTLLQRFLKTDILISEKFIENYLNLILNVYHTNCNDLKQLEFISDQLFPVYCKPLIYATTESYTMHDLFNVVLPYFEKDLRIDLVDSFAQDKLKSILKCPRVARYLIISAYLASRLSKKNELQIFEKNSSKSKANKSQLNTTRKTIGNTFDERGPKSFNYFRLVDIFKSISAHEQFDIIDFRMLIKHLIEIKVLANASISKRSDLTQQNFKCILNCDYVSHIAQSINFNLYQYFRDT